MTFDEMIEELKSESPEARQFYERCEKMAEEMELFGDLTWWDRLTANISAWIQIILHRIKRKLL